MFFCLAAFSLSSIDVIDNYFFRKFSGKSIVDNKDHIQNSNILKFKLENSKQEKGTFKYQIMWFFVSFVQSSHEKLPILEDGLNTVLDPDVISRLNWNTMVPMNSQIFKRDSNGEISCKSGAINLTNLKSPSCSTEEANCQLYTESSNTFSFYSSECSTLESQVNVYSYNNSHDWDIKYGELEMQRQFSGDPSISGNFINSETTYNIVRCLLFPTDQKSCNNILNLCVLNHFNSNHPSCQILTQISTTSKLNQSGYFYWPMVGPFYKYSDIMKHILEEDYMESNYTHSDELSLYLSRYSHSGEFIGYKKIILDFQRCQTRFKVHGIFLALIIMNPVLLIFLNI